MDQQTPGAQSEASRSAQPAYTPAPHHAPLPSAGQPDLAKRVVAVLIDCVAIAVIAWAVSIVSPLLGAVAGLAALLLRDVAVQGRSPGKKVMGLNVRTASGGPITPIESIKRNATLGVGQVGSIIAAAIPLLGLLPALPLWGIGFLLGVYEIYLVVTNQPRLGDKLAGTHVVVDGAPAIAI